MIGIYGIRNRKSGRIYIGSAIDIAKRLKRHKSDLACGRHHCIHLQRSWTRNSANNFSFYVIEELHEAKWLLVREQFHIDTAAREGRAYNICLTAGNCLGVKHSDETKKKRSIALTGRICSEETKAAISAKAKARGAPKSFAKMIAASRARKFTLNIDQAEAAIKLHNNGLTWAQVATTFKTNPKLLRREINACGFETRILPKAKGNRKYLEGESHPMSKITEDDARYIILSNSSLSALAEKFNLTSNYVSELKTGRAWRKLHQKIKEEAICQIT